MAYIDGEIPPIVSKTPRMVDFSMHSRKSSPYLLQNELHSAFNRKISHFTLTLLLLVTLLKTRPLI